MPWTWVMGSLALLALVLGLFLGWREARAHEYALWPPAQGLWVVWTQQLRRLWLWSGLLGILTLAPWLPRPGYGVRRARVAGSWALLVALSLWSWQGYQFNRYRAAAAWRETHEWMGLPLPVALTEPSILGRNVVVTLTAGLLFFLLRSMLMRRLPDAFAPAPRWWKVSTLLAALFGLAVAARPLELGRPQPKGPDIVLISLDATRADHLGVYRQPGFTPQLDALARRSEIFERAYCQEPWTLTSHMSMLSGLYPDAHGLDFGRALPPAIWTLPERLREAGYRTAASVRDCFLLSPRFGYGAGFDRYEEDQRSASERCRAAADWLLSANRPGFLFLHLYDPHSDTGALPYEAPTEFQRGFDPAAAFSAFSAFSSWAGQGGASEALRRVNAGELALPDSLAARIPALYAAGIAATDAALGEFFERLRAAGRLDSTLIVIIADHGEALGERSHWMHEELMQATLHIPLVVHWPGGERAGGRRRELAESVDLLPTLLEAAGLPTSGILQGQSLARPLSRRFSFHRSGPQYAITTQDGWRLSYEMGAGGFRPLSLRRLDGSGSDGPDLLADSLQVVDRWIAPIEELHRANAALAARWRGGAVTLDAADEALLRSLGYLN